MLRDDLDIQLNNISDLHIEAGRLFEDMSADNSGQTKLFEQLSHVDKQAELVQSELDLRLQHLTDVLVEVSSVFHWTCKT